MKRFYKQVDVKNTNSGYAVLLDDKTIKTPAGSALEMPTEKLAKAVAKEWDNIKDGEQIKPETMGYMQLVSTAIDKVVPNMTQVSHNVVAYAMNDLICYRAEPELADLRLMQDNAWDSWVKWAKESENIDLIVGQGVVPIRQSPVVKVNAMLALYTMNGFKLTAMADLTAIYGSFVLGLAVINGKLDASGAFDVSRVDEMYQMQNWGRDEDAEKTADMTKAELEKTVNFIKLL